MNSVEYDPRVRNVGAMLRDAGHQVVFVGIVSEGGLGRADFVEADAIDGVPRYLIRCPKPWLALGPGVEHGEPLRRALTLAGQAVWSARLLWATSRVMTMDPAVIHAHDLGSFRLIAHAAAARGIPTVYDSHELERGRMVPRWGRLRRKLHTWSEHVTIKRADAVITVAPSIAEVMRDAHDIELPLVICNTHPRTHIQPGPPLSKRLGLPTGARTVLYLGKITAGRGLEHLMRALPRLRGEVHVAIYGQMDPTFAADWEAMLDRLGTLRARVHVSPPVPYEDVITTAWGADVGFNGIECLCESYHHALPNKFFEYVFAGVPVVSTPGVSVAGLIRVQDLGEVYAYEDVGALADAINRMLERRMRISESARHRIIEQYCRESQAHRLVGLYDRLLRVGPAHGR
jgi:glycosyltransferase involved in cell wall biosynthesis